MDFTPANEMTEEELNELLEGSRERGVYPKLIKDFLTSDFKSVNVASNFPNKKLSSVAAGIRAAAKKADAPIKVIHKEIKGTDYLALVKN